MAIADHLSMALLIVKVPMGLDPFGDLSFHSLSQ
jgi:hypothetical protein